MFLFAIGIISILGLLWSLWYVSHFSSDWPFRSFSVSLYAGTVWLDVSVDGDASYQAGTLDAIGDDFGMDLHGFEMRPNTERAYPSKTPWPTVEYSSRPWYRRLKVGIPLWLLAAICLAWPVTSFIVARRKRRRGFPVEPASAPPLPPGEGVTQLAEGGRSDG